MEQRILVCTLCDDLFSTAGELGAHKKSAHNLQDGNFSSSLKTCAFCNESFKRNELSTSNNFLCYKCQISQPCIVLKKKSLIEAIVQSKSKEFNNSISKQQKESNEDFSNDEHECICETCGQRYQEVHKCDISFDVQREVHEGDTDKCEENQERQMINNSRSKKQKGKFNNSHEDLPNVCNDNPSDRKNNIVKGNISCDLQELKHRCSVCDKVCKDIKCFNKHLKKHVEFLHKCKLCQKDIWAKVITKSPTGEIFNEIIPKLCNSCTTIQIHFKKLGVDCDFEKDDLSGYNREYFKNHGLFPCSKCLRVYKTASNVRRHELNHTKEHLCISCGSAYVDYHKCPLQENSSWSDQDDQRVLKESCDDSINKLTPVCGICNKTFRNFDILNRHLQTMHKKVYDYYCKICKIHFYTNKRIFKRDFVIGGSLKSFHIINENEDEEKTLLENDDETSKINSKSSKTENKNLENNYQSSDSEDKIIENGDNIIEKIDKVIDTNGNEVLCDDNTILDIINEISDKQGKCGNNLRKKIELINLLFKKLALKENGLQNFEKIEFATYHAIGESQCDNPRHCQLCHKTFCSLNAMMNHLECHLRKQIHCKKCGKTFVHKYHHAKHKCGMNPEHENKNVVKKPSVKCNVCGKVLANVSTLYKHSAIHAPKNHVCEICGCAFGLKENLKEHYIKKHGDGDIKTCPVCFKVLKGRQSLNSHILRFHSEIKNKEIPSFVCSDCGRVFRQKGNLHKHQLSHSNNLTFKCTLCNIFFKYPEQLRRHTLLHTNGLKYECNMCDQKFVLNFFLKKHINEYHGGILYPCKFCDVTCKRLNTIHKHLSKKHSRILEWQNHPWSFARSLAIQSTNYVNVQTTSGSSKDANNSRKMIKRIKKKLFNSDEDEDEDEDDYENDNQSDDDKIDVSDRDVEEKEEDNVDEQSDEDDEGNDNDESSNEDGEQLLVKNKRVNKSKDDENSGGWKFKDEDEDYQPPSAISNKRKLYLKLAKHSALPVKKIKENYVDKNYQNLKSNVIRFKTEQASKLNHSIKTSELKHTQSFTGSKKDGELVKTPPVDNLSNKKTVGSKLVNFRHNQQYKDNIISSVSAINNNNNIGSPAPNINNTNALNNKMSNAKNLIFTIPFNNNHSSIMVPTNESNNIMNAIEFVDCTNLNYSNMEIVETQFLPGFEVEIDAITYLPKK